ncbi:UBX domain-containing protein 7-like isoform X1 [Centruroides sculpturatus]|uniref:UBX domain-containing protein 7-like isoform X1 n=1 Tax=Centruroides sculpturatus TaxID=218467 RepID=UPI000C6E8688|nr:UBX domain-containing protein 7-like isoform X1 [Centruroides sculpturatus]
MASSSQPKHFKSLIEKFCAITGADENAAKNLLEICNGNLEVAINMHCDYGSETVQNPSRGSSSKDGEDVRPPIPPTRGVLVDTLPFGPRGRQQSSQSIFDGFRDFQAEAKWQEENLSLVGTKLSKKRKTLEDLFRPPLDLMHRGSLESARELGRTTNRWLMVNIQNVQEFACQVLNRDVWSNAAVKSIISEHFVFWQVYCESEDGQRYIQFYNVTEYPYIAILDPRTGEKLVVWNNIDSVSFCDLVTEFLSHQPSPDGTSSNKKLKVESIVDKSEEQQLKAAIEASLNETVSKLSGKGSDLSDDDDTDVETFESDSESSLPNNHDSKNKHIKENSKHCENNENVNDKSASNWKMYLGSNEDPKSELIIRFPDGRRQHITFPCSSQLQALLLYAVSSGYPAETYELVTHFPRRRLCTLDKEQTLKEAGLFPRETIFIQLKND